MMILDPVKGDTVRWSVQRWSERRGEYYTVEYKGTVRIAHPNRWLVWLGGGKCYDLSREMFEASGEVVQAARPRLALVTS